MTRPLPRPSLRWRPSTRSPAAPSSLALSGSRVQPRSTVSRHRRRSGGSSLSRSTATRSVPAPRPSGGNARRRRATGRETSADAASLGELIGTHADHHVDVYAGLGPPMVLASVLISSAAARANAGVTLFSSTPSTTELECEMRHLTSRLWPFRSADPTAAQVVPDLPAEPPGLPAVEEGARGGAGEQRAQGDRAPARPGD